MQHNNSQLPLFFRANIETSAQLKLAQGLSLKRYNNDSVSVVYENTHQHTLSMYIDGGHQTYRLDEQGPGGGPGRFCVLPKDSYSRWHVGNQQDFVHLYFDEDYMKRLAVETLDKDPRTVTLPQLTFTENKAMEAILRHCILGQDWGAHNQLAIQQACNTLMVQMLGSYSVKATSIHKTLTINAGLSPSHTRTVIDFMRTHFHRQINLAELSQLTGLSEYHFCRMFKISTAYTPQQYIQKVRIECAKQLLADATNGLASVALQCGFANQSHFGRVFKQLVGCTPRQYRYSK